MADSLKQRESKLDLYLDYIFTKKRVYKKLNGLIVCVFTAILAAYILIFNVAVWKFQYQAAMYGQILNNQQAFDKSSRLIQSLVTSLKVADFQRALTEGVLEDDVYSNWQPKSLRQALTSRKQALVGSLLLSYLEYHATVKNFSEMPTNILTSRYDLNSILDSSTLVSLQDYDATNYQKTGKAEGTESTKTVKSAISKTSQTLNDFLRNQNIEPIGNSRDLIPDEEMLRKNLQGDLLTFAIASFEKLGTYFMDINSLHLKAQLNYFIILVLIYIGILVSVAVYLVRHSIRVNYIVSNAFNLRVDSS